MSKIRKRMRLYFSIAISFCLVSQQAFGADLCQSLVTQLRGQPDFISGERGLGQSILENSDIFQQTHENEGVGFRTDTELSDYSATLTRKFHLPKLPWEGDILWIEAAPSTPFFAFASMSGTMRCQTFVLYERGNPARELGEPPQSAGASDGLCESSKGAFGRLAGTPAFVVHDWDILTYSEKLSITPVTSGRWGNTCKIEARFEPQFQLVHAFVPQGGIAKEDFSTLALEFTRLHGLQPKGPETIAIDSAPSPEAIAQTQAMAATFRENWITDLPQFGDTQRANGAFSRGEFYPLMFRGRPYMMQFSFGWGYHDSLLPQAYLIMFESRDGKPVPVASAKVDIPRGKLSSLN